MTDVERMREAIANVVQHRAGEEMVELEPGVWGVWRVGPRQSEASTEAVARAICEVGGVTARLIKRLDDPETSADAVDEAIRVLRNLLAVAGLEEDG